MDLGAMSLCGFACSANAHDAVLQRAHLVTRKPGSRRSTRGLDFVLRRKVALDEMLLPWLPQ